MDKINKDNIDVCVFHYPCQDGLGSAYIANHYAKANKKSLKLFPLQHNQIVDWSEINNVNVLFTDIAPTDEIIKLLIDQGCQIQILDHHITAKERLEKCDFAIFDMNLSGIGLTWKYFYDMNEMPTFLTMMQEQDIWKFKTKYTKEFCSGFLFKCQCENTIEDKFKLMDVLMGVLMDVLICDNSSINEYISLGTTLLRHKMAQIESIVDKNKNNVKQFREYSVILYNCSNYDLVSELGNILSKDYCDFAVLWSYDHLDKKYHVSLRSCKGICASIAKEMMNGGGHPNAAGGATDIHPEILFSN